jgi:16S rRNA G527 N7-methylase RsmG
VKAETTIACRIGKRLPFDFIVSRAVTNMSDLRLWVKDKIKRKVNTNSKNGILISKAAI